MADNWEDLYDEGDTEVEQVAHPTVSSSSSVTKKTDQVFGRKIGSLRGNDELGLSDDPRKREELLREQDAQLFGDLLDGCDLTDQARNTQAAVLSKPKLARTVAVTSSSVNRFDTIELKNISDCNKFVEAIGDKIDSSSAKSPAWLAFLSGLLTHIVPKMDSKDLKTLANKLDKMSKDQISAKTIAAQNKVKIFKKQNDQLSNPKAEYDMLYGNHDKDHSDDDYDDM